ncbi:MAG: hypothetical protein ABL994_13290 [Verrucomicrobiales bacterium]
MKPRLLLYSVVAALLTHQGIADDALLMTEEQVRAKHEGTLLRELIYEPPGTDRALYLSENHRTRTYGFDVQGKVVLIIEESNKVIPRNPMLAECRSTHPWFWHIKMKDDSVTWVPVGVIPPNAQTKSPADHQNSDGKQVVPDAFARAKRTGNLLIIWDKAWAGNPDDAGFRKRDEEVELWLDQIETLRKEDKPVVK